MLLAAGAGGAVARVLRRPIRGYRKPPARLAVGASMTGVFALLAWRVPAPLPLLAYCWVAALGLAAGFVDGAVHRLPDRFTLPAFAGALAVLTVDALLTGRFAALGTAVLSGLAAAAFYAGLVLVNPAGMGAGDAKLALSLGTVLGWLGGRVAVAGVVAGITISVGYAMYLLIRRRVGRRDPLPHGPAMLLGALLAIVVAG
jgi:leader peptidase (prepilin peptidase) / N-methyltransferase